MSYILDNRIKVSHLSTNGSPTKMMYSFGKTKRFIKMSNPI